MASTVWRGHLTFGLISIPVRLFRGARAERVPLRRVARVRAVVPEQITAPQAEVEVDRPKLTFAAGSRITGREAETLDSGMTAGSSSSYEQLIPVRQSSVSREAGAAVPESAITRGVEVAKGRFVEIPAEELKSLKSATSSDMAIQEFVALSEIDPVYFETSYYVVPEEVGQKAYGLLYRALVNTEVVALAEVSMHGRDHVAVVRPGQTGLVAHTMFYVSEVHLEEQFGASESGVSAKELELADTLIRSLTTTFDPQKYKNGYQEKLQQLIASKVGSAPAETPMQPKSADVVDIADALRRSLAQLKKPVQPSGISKSQPRSNRMR